MTQPAYTPPPDHQAIPIQVPSLQKTRVPDDSQLAARWILHNRNAKWGLNEWRKYKDGIWLPVDKDIIRQEIKTIIDRAKPEGVKSTASLLSSVMELARVDIAVPADMWDANPDYLPCRNGVLHIPTKTLLPHTPDIYATSQLSFDYDPDATCPNFEYALQQIPDAIDFVQEFAGYSLTPETKHEIAIWFYGEKGSGKSTLIEGITKMLGPRAGSLGLAEIERSRFAFSELPGKTLVVSTENPDSYLKMTHTLNALISGEPIRVEEKYQEAVTIRPHAKILWAMNELPRVSANNGLMRRVKVIKFPSLPPDKKDVDLKKRIKDEAAGILNWALAGLDRLNFRGRFDIPRTVEDATKDFQDKNDIVATFLEEVNARIDLTDPKCKTQGQDLYDKYNDWCRRNGHTPMSSTRVAEEWKRLNFVKRKIGGVNYWLGVELPYLGNIP